MGRKVPAPAAETPVAPSQAPAAKSRPRSPSQPSTARPVLRSRRSVSLSRQSDSPSEAAPSAPRFIDVVRASLSPDASRKGSGRHSGQDKSKGRGKGKRSPSREERAPAVELTPRESIKPSQTSERRHSGRASDQSPAMPNADIPAETARARARTIPVMPVLAPAPWTLRSNGQSTASAQPSSTACG